MDSRVADSEAQSEEKQGVPAIIISKASPDTATTAEQDHAPVTSESEVRGQIEGQAGEVTSQYVHDTKTEEPSDDRGSVSSSADRSADEGLVAMETDSDDAVGTADDVGIVRRSSEKEIEANGSETRDTLEYGKSEDSQSDGEKVGEDEGGRDGEGMEVGSTEGEMEERRASEMERQDETGEEGEEAEMMDVDDGGKDQGKLQGRMEEPQMDTDDKIVEESSLSSTHGETSGLGDGASSEGVIETSEQEKEASKGAESQKEGEEGCESKIDEHQKIRGSDDGAIEAESSVTEDKKEKEIIPDQDTVQSSSNNQDDAKEVGREDDVCKDDDGMSRKNDFGEEDGEKDQGGMERAKEDSEMEKGEISPDSNVDLESQDKKTEVEKSNATVLTKGRAKYKMRRSVQRWGNSEAKMLILGKEHQLFKKDEMMRRFVKERRAKLMEMAKLRRRRRIKRRSVVKKLTLWVPRPVNPLNQLHMEVSMMMIRRLIMQALWRVAQMLEKVNNMMDRRWKRRKMGWRKI